MLALLYAINTIIQQIKVEFPASVALMLILYLLLLVSQLTIGKHYTGIIIKFIEIPANFALKWINLFFIPSFVTLPLAERISVTEAFIIAAVFVIGYVAMFAGMAYLVIGLQMALKQTRRSHIERAEEWNEPGTGQAVTTKATNDGGANINSDNDSDLRGSGIPGDGEEIELASRVRGASLPSDESSKFQISKHGSFSEHILEEDGNELDSNHSKSNNNNSENGSIDLEIPQSAINRDRQLVSSIQPSAPLHKGKSRARSISPPVVNQRLYKIEQEAKQEELQREEFHQYVAQLPERSIAISQQITKYFDWAVYVLIFAAGIPVYFAANYNLLLHLSISVLLFKLALLIPARWKKIFHPILVSFPFMLLLIYIFAVIKRDGFLDTIKLYKTGRTYLYLFNKAKSPTTHWPGAGDFLSACMDISIVSLALPMFNYRQDLRKHYLVFIPPIIACTCLSFFAYPPICHAVSIAPLRSLGFVGRSVTLALGTPLVKSLSGSVPLMAVSTILSGILGVLCGDYMLKWLRVKEDDYITIGITLGLNCGAISTGHLLINNPRAAAISSLSFSIFGAIMVVLAAIRPVASLVQGWAGLT